MLNNKRYFNLLWSLLTIKYDIFFVFLFKHFYLFFSLPILIFIDLLTIHIYLRNETFYQFISYHRVCYLQTYLLSDLLAL